MLDQLAKMKRGWAVLGVLVMWLSVSANAQGIVGAWQLGGSTMGSTTAEHYVFRADGTFYFHVTNYDGLNPIRAFSGTYRTNGDTLWLNTQFVYEIVGWTSVLHDHMCLSNHGWELVGGKLEKRPIHHNEDEFELWVSPSVLLLDREPYYRIKEEDYDDIESLIKKQ